MTTFTSGIPALRLTLLGAATSLLACAPTAGVTRIYTGTATLQADEDPARAVDSNSVRLTECSVNEGGDVERPRVDFALLSIGDGCTFSGRWDQTTFLVDQPGQQCTLLVHGAWLRVRVTDVMATRTVISHHHAKSTSNVPDESALSIRMGATLVETGPSGTEAPSRRRALFELTAPLTSETDSLAWCEQAATTRKGPGE